MPATLDQATALVLIDLQHGITVQPTVHPSEQIVARCARLAIAFRANGKLIAATRVAFGQDPASRILARYCQYRGPGTLPGRLTLGSGEWVMAAGSEMADFVLVHSAWFGGWCWKKLVPLLAGHGHSVHTPTLTGLGDRSHLAHPGIVLQTHVDDVVNTLTYQDLRAVILVGTSSSGAVITGVADRVPDRISQLIYVDAFVPGDGQALWDLIPPQRRPAMETLVQTEGFGWLLPRFAAQPWEQFAREAWQVTDEADLTWMLTRLRPTPFGHFTSPVRLVNPQRNGCREPTSGAVAGRTRASTATPRPPAKTPAGTFTNWTAATCPT